jgi:hypothetical protein
MRAVVVFLLLALASPALNLLLAAEPPQRTLIRSTPPVNVYSYENAAGETVEEMENRQGQLIGRRFYRPAPPACAYMRSLGLETGRYWRDDGDSIFRCVSPVKELGTVADPLGLGSKTTSLITWTEMPSGSIKCSSTSTSSNITKRNRPIRPSSGQPNG